MKKATSAKNNPATADFEILVEDYNVTPFIITRLNFVMAKRVDKFIKNPPQCFCEFTGKRFNWHTETTKWDKFGKETSKLIKKLGFNKKTSAIFEIARDWVLLKEARKESFFACYASMDKLAEEIAKRLNTEKIQIKYLTKEELKSALFKNIFPEDIKNRCKKSIYAYADGKDIIYTDHDAEKYLKKYKKAESLKNNTGTIKGQVAYKGIVTGKVKIIREPSDMKKMMAGDILVSPATNPNLLPAMKKASAFITDVGGITCHAAIVARELKTPCVIGTKIATKILRDGDFVEVDADNGIVKILSAH